MLEAKSSYVGSLASIIASPPPILCPMTNTGIDDGKCDRTNDATSAITWVVGPVNPLSDGFETDRPHPR
jgi:hypothetical protein